ncbi:bacteriohemerythrin [Magnetococcus marinus]|uniref:bacteriohemerythrin n=1 Tax=Magnetococcus marinus TaxID=1124597 RepID=UPI00003C5860|nr:bacteriohemerythrin [Magnetococcus marinus]
MNIKKTLVLTNGLLAATIALILGIILWTTAEQQSDSVTINMAGRQRMLSQKIAKEFGLYLANPNQTEKSLLLTSVWAFDTTLHALLTGGQAPTKLDRNTPALVQIGHPNDEILTKLKAVQALWQPLAQQFKALESNPTDLNGLAKLVTTQNMPLLKEMNSAVTMMQNQAEGKVSRIINTALFGALLGLVIFALALYQTRLLSQRLKRAFGTLEHISRGSLDHQLSADDPTHEVDQIAEKINIIVNQLSTSTQLVILQSDSVAACANELLKLRDMLNDDSEMTSKAMAAASEKLSELEQAIVSIQDKIGDATHSIENIADSSTYLSSGITTMASAAEQASQNVSTMAAAAEEMTSNLSAVNSSIQNVNQATGKIGGSLDEMISTLEDVRQRCVVASHKSQQANQHIHSTLKVMNELSNSANEIDRFVDLINNIAEQTNMLALNASIEAAGAGESGKGFAVVANEVKELAHQTSEVTTLISGQIRIIQDHSKNAQQATEGVSEIVTAINQANDEITYAVDDQNHAIHEISSSFNAVVQASQEVTRNVDELYQAANEVSRAALDAASGTNEIALSANASADSAQKVSENAQMVHQLVQAIFTETSTTIAAAEVTEKSIQTASQRATYISGTVHNFVILIDVLQAAMEALRAAQAVYKTGHKSFDVRTIKEGHLAWLRELEQAVHGRSVLDAKEAANYRGCDFGLWYYGDGQQRYGNEALFVELGTVHQKVHEAAFEVVNLVQSGSVEQAYKSMDRFKQLRKELFILLDGIYFSGLTINDQKMIDWEDALDVGVKVLNADHLKLMNYINDLHAAMRDGKGKDKLATILAGLIEFTHTHFAREEGLMKKHGYDRYAQQKEEHVNLIAQLGEKKKQFDEGSATVALDLLAFLQNWLIDHIKGEDMRYKTFFQSKGEL